MDSDHFYWDASDVDEDTFYSDEYESEFDSDDQDSDSCVETDDSDDDEEENVERTTAVSVVIYLKLVDSISFILILNIISN